MPTPPETDAEWKPVYTPFSADLTDVVHAANGPYAVGTSGVVAGKRGGGWEAVVDTGPADNNSTLKAAAVTDDGRRVWFVGASGAIGAYDLDERRKYNYTYDGDASPEWHDVTVTGPVGEERAYVANGSGAVVEFSVTGTDVTFGATPKPGDGATIRAVQAAPSGVAYAVDTSGRAYENAGSGWSAIGSLEVQLAFNDIYAGPEGVYVAAGDGRLYRYDDSGEWTPVRVGQNALRSVDVHGGRIVVLADGAIYERPVSGGEWTSVPTPTGSDLLALALGYPDVVVGNAGTVVNRPPHHPPEQPEPTPDEQPAERGQVCTLLVEALVDRLSRAELVELIERRDRCDTALVEQLDEITAERRRERLRRLPVTRIPAARTRVDCEPVEPRAERRVEYEPVEYEPVEYEPVEREPRPGGERRRERRGERRGESGRRRADCAEPERYERGETLTVAELERLLEA
ncbi:WD40/YVTN/BNR-like repeat-containing protein [Halobaculum sp. P14]|uniref:WD40/YVTN/BNR-like repeat-containing protein n=1 Tax=Halobaculum sp. P14 TaxID=3421638 RepID=UPI003EB74131